MRFAGHKPVKEDHRICFGVAWFKSESEAKEAGTAMRESGRTVNGGWLHGMPCDRSPEFDYEDPQQGKLYAIRT